MPVWLSDCCRHWRCQEELSHTDTPEATCGAHLPHAPLDEDRVASIAMQGDTGTKGGSGDI